MLSQGIKKAFIWIIIGFIFFSCENSNRGNKKIEEIVNKFSYKDIYLKAIDTLKTFQLNKIDNYNFLNAGNWYLDSLFCFDGKNERIISSILYTNSNTKEATHDGIQFFYGERINGLWFFFKGPSVHVPREMIEEQDVHQPLSYQQLHKIALKEVYSGYLNSKGEINEEWFIGQLEGPSWGAFDDQASSDWFLKGKRFKTRKEYFEFVHYEKARNNWASRDTTKPILQLP